MWIKFEICFTGFFGGKVSLGVSYAKIRLQVLEGTLAAGNGPWHMFEQRNINKK